MEYKKDVIIGTWVSIGLFLTTTLLTLVHFDNITTRVEPTPECDVCRWTNPNPTK